MADYLSFLLNAMFTEHIEVNYFPSTDGWLPLFPVKANWMVFPPTPQNASTTMSHLKDWLTRPAMCSAIFSGVTENQPSVKEEDFS